MARRRRGCSASPASSSPPTFAGAIANERGRSGCAGAPLLDEDDAARMDARIDAAAQSRRLYEAMDGLPEAERTVLELVALDELLSYVAAQPDLVFVDLVESYSAGPEAIRRSYENWNAYTLFLEEGYRRSPEAEALPRICSEAIGGAIQQLIRLQVVRGRGGAVLDILPEAAYLALAPFIGAEEALALVKSKAAGD